MRQESNHRMNSGEKEFPSISNGRAMGVIILIVLLFVFQVTAFVVQKIRIAALERDGVEDVAAGGVLGGTSAEFAAGSAAGGISVSAAGELFPFNPNDISLDSLQLLGFSRKQAQTIINYRGKGGKFRQKKDFAKMYVVDSAKYQTLAPYILLPDRTPAPTASLVHKRGISGTKPAEDGSLVRKRGISGTKPAEDGTLVHKRGISGTKPAEDGSLVRKRGISGTKPAEDGSLVRKRGISGTKPAEDGSLVHKRGISGTKPAEDGTLVRKRGISGTKPAEEDTLYGQKVERNRYMCNLNTADSAALVQLYGIGGYYAQKIIKYRERLGGSFVSPLQLLEIENFTRERYSKIEKNIFVRQEDIIGFSITRASRKSLERHPYIGPYAARGIITYLRMKLAKEPPVSSGSAVGNEFSKSEASAAMSKDSATSALSSLVEIELTLLKKLVEERILTQENARKLEEYLLHL